MIEIHTDSHLKWKIEITKIFLISYPIWMILMQREEEEKKKGARKQAITHKKKTTSIESS